MLEQAMHDIKSETGFAPVSLTIASSRDREHAPGSKVKTFSKG